MILTVDIVQQPIINDYHIIPSVMIDMCKLPFNYSTKDIPNVFLYDMITEQGDAVSCIEWFYYRRNGYDPDDEFDIAYFLDDLFSLSLLYYDNDDNNPLCSVGTVLRYCDSANHKIRRFIFTY